MKYRKSTQPQDEVTVTMAASREVLKDRSLELDPRREARIAPSDQFVDLGSIPAIGAQGWELSRRTDVANKWKPQMRPLRAAFLCSGHSTFG